MLGHAVANTIPLVASNRVGDENGQRFYGTSFIADGRGDILAELGGEAGRGDRRARFGRLAEGARWFGLLRDRRPECTPS